MLKGLLDTLNSEEGQLGLAMLAAAGPQAQPMSFGQRMAGVMQQQQARKQAEEDRKLKQLMTSLQMEDILSRRDEREIGRQRERAKQGYLGAIASGAEFSPAMALQYGLGKDEIGALTPKPKEPIKVGAGDVLVDPTTFKPQFTAPTKPAEPPTSFREWQLSQTNPGFDGWLTRRDASKTPKVEVNTSDPTAVANFSLKLQNDVRGAFKGDNVIANQYRAMQNAVQNPSAKGDTALLYSFFKVLDPESTVREGELDLVMSSRSIPDKLKGYAQRLQSGQVLTPSERADLLAQAGEQVKARMGRADAEMKSYRSVAKTMGLDPEQLVPNPYAGIDFNAGQKEPKPKSRIVQLDGGGSASAELGADGNYYVRRNGKLYRVED